VILPRLKFVFSKCTVKKLKSHHVLDMKYRGNYLFQDCLRRKQSIFFQAFEKYSRLISPYGVLRVQLLHSLELCVLSRRDHVSPGWEELSWVFHVAGICCGSRQWNWKQCLFSYLLTYKCLALQP